MSDDKRLSVSFGAFSCEIIGYEDPVSVLNRTVAALRAAADANPALGQSEEIGDLERARLTAALAADAAVVGVSNGAHIVLTRSEDGAFADEEAARRKPLNIAPPPEPAPMDDAAPDEAEAAIEPTAAEPVATDDCRTGDPEPWATAPETQVYSAETPEPAADETAEPAMMDDSRTGDPEPSAATPKTQVHRAETPEPAPDQTAEPAMMDDSRTGDPEPPAATPQTPVYRAETPEPTPDRTAEPAAMDDRRTGDPEPQATAWDATHPEENAGQPAPPPETGRDDPAPVAMFTDDTPLAADAAKPADDDRPSLAERIAAYTSQIAAARLTPVAETPPPAAPAEAETPPPADPVAAGPAPQPAAPAEAEPPRTAEIVEAFPQADRELEPNEEEIARIAAERMADDDLGVDDAPGGPDGLENVLRSIDNLNGGGGSARPGFLSESEASLDPDEDDEDRRPRRNFAAFLRRGVAARRKQEDIDLDAAAAIGFERLKKSARQRSQLDDWDDAPSVPIAERQIRAVGAEALHSGVSPTRFAEYVRAASLHDLLEASAVYLALVDGKPRFSRRDVMVALSQIGDDRDYPQQARLKSFRKLLTTGAIVRVDDGMYSVSEGTWKGYRQKLVG